jgi:hypothetical protein
VETSLEVLVEAQWGWELVEVFQEVPEVDLEVWVLRVLGRVDRSEDNITITIIPTAGSWGHLFTLLFYSASYI